MATVDGPLDGIGKCGRAVDGPPTAFANSSRITNIISRKTGWRGAKKKGQFFLLGAFLISTLFFAGLPRPASINVEGTEDLGFIALNMQKEMPNAFNLGLAQGDYLGVMKNFTWFSARVLRNHMSSFGLLLCFGSNVSTDDFNVTVFNYLGHNETVNITIGSSTYVMLVPYNESNSTEFTGVDELFGISFRYSDEEKNTTWVRQKHSIYGAMNMTRRDSIIIKDFEG